MNALERIAIFTNPFVWVFLLVYYILIGLSWLFHKTIWSRKFCLSNYFDYLHVKKHCKIGLNEQQLKYAMAWVDSPKNKTRPYYKQRSERIKQQNELLTSSGLEARS